MSGRAYTEDQLVEQPAIDELMRDRSAMTPAGANSEAWALLKDGVKVAVPDRECGRLKAA